MLKVLQMKTYHEQSMREMRKKEIIEKNVGQLYQSWEMKPQPLGRRREREG